MKDARTVFTIVTGAFLVSLFILVHGVNAETVAELRNQIAVHNTQIEQLNKDIAAYEKQLVDIGSKKQTLQNTLSSLDISRKKITAQINVTKNSISALELEIRTLNGSISDKEASIARDKASIASAMQSLEQIDQVSLVEQMLGSEALSSVWDSVETNYRFQDALFDHVESLAETKEQLTESRDESQKKHAELDGQRKKLIGQQQSLDVNRREQQALLTQTKSQESNYQALLKEKQAAREAFEQALNALESKLEYTLDPSRIPSAGKGVLRWPLDSVKVTQYFGNSEFARSGGYNGKGHNGVDFRAAIGTPVKAALAGTVEGTGNSDAVRGCYSYGKWVLIKHQNGLSTLYAHLSQISVEEGEKVGTGETIGYSGNTGYSTGPHLHFGVYASNGVRVMKLGESTGKKSPCANAIIPVSPLGAYLNPMDYL